MKINHNNFFYTCNFSYNMINLEKLGSLASTLDIFLSASANMCTLFCLCNPFAEYFLNQLFWVILIVDVFPHCTPYCREVGSCEQ